MASGQARGFSAKKKTNLKLSLFGDAEDETENESNHLVLPVREKSHSPNNPRLQTQDNITPESLIDKIKELQLWSDNDAFSNTGTFDAGALRVRKSGIVEKSDSEDSFCEPDAKNASQSKDAEEVDSDVCSPSSYRDGHFVTPNKKKPIELFSATPPRDPYFLIRSTTTPESSRPKSRQLKKMKLSDIVRICLLGRGASGAVYKAVHIPSLLLLAVKDVRISEGTTSKRIGQELESMLSLSATTLENLPNASVVLGSLPDRAARNFSIDHIVGFYNAYAEADKLSVSIVMEFMAAGSLKELVNRYEEAGETMSERTLAFIACDILSGLAVLHAEHCIHRDIKPENLLLTRDGRVKLADFGLARQLQSTYDHAVSNIGTFKYMSPERIRAEHYTITADIWSFGLVMYTCALNRFPLEVEGGLFGFAQALNEASPHMTPENSGRPEVFCDFVNLCLDQNPQRRPSAIQLLQHDFLEMYSIDRMPQDMSDRLTDTLEDPHHELYEIATCLGQYIRSIVIKMTEELNSSTSGKEADYASNFPCRDDFSSFLEFAGALLRAAGYTEGSNFCSSESIARLARQVGLSSLDIRNTLEEELSEALSVADSLDFSNSHG